MLLKLSKKNKNSLEDFYNKRNKILFIRNARGIGDILTARMLFEDVKKIMPEAHITFACQEAHAVLMKNHPFVDEVESIGGIDKSKYNISYDISTCCWKWESKMAPNANKHRADIWAEHCGFTLTSHNMHLPFLSEELIQKGNDLISKLKKSLNFKDDVPNVLFTPFAFDALRTLQNHQIEGVINYLKNKNVFIYSTHSRNHKIFQDLKVPILFGGTEDWLSYIHAADYVITADTSVFHYAGGIKKPMTGIFTHADGKYRGQYFDFVLVQKHRDEGNWPCGPCYNHTKCTHPENKNPGWNLSPRPCLTHLTVNEIICGIEKMFQKYTLLGK